MELSDVTSPAGVDNPQETRTCAKCEKVTVVTPQTWPYRKGRKGFYQPEGTYCLECEKARKREYETRRKSIATGVAALSAPSKGTPEEQKKALKQANRLDVAQALKAGSIAVNQVAPGVMARIMEYLEDPDHKHHIWALELIAQRVLPRKLYEELGGQAAGVGTLQDKRPMFVLNVHPANPGVPQGAVYDQEGHVQLVPPVAEEPTDAG